MRKIIFVLIAIILASCDIDPKVLNTTNIYEIPDSNSYVVGEVPKNSDVTLSFKVYNWCRIQYKDIVGYIHCSDLDLPEAPKGELSGKNVIVDAGHGGKDNGAIVDNVKEKDINRAVADYLIADLTLAGANVIETRKNDETLYLYDRPLLTNLFLLDKLYLEAADQDKKKRLTELIMDIEGYLASDKNEVYDIFKKGDDMTLALQTIFELSKEIDDTVFVSIHSNVSGQSDVELQGLDIILTGNNVSDQYPGYDQFNDEERKFFGDTLGKYIPEATGMNLRRTYFGDYAVLREQNIPSSLIELGYMDNKKDLDFLLDKDNQANYAKGIMNAIIEFFKTNPY